MPPPRLLPSYVDDTHHTQPAPNDLRSPSPLSTLFLIDVSQHTADSTLLKLVCDTIRDTLFNDSAEVLNASQLRRVGFMTFDTVIHFYDVSVRAFVMLYQCYANYTYAIRLALC